MGMSSSQARLLTLTARLHSIEHKAQKLEAEKLRLANDSSRVYDEYLDRLEATKIQYSLLGADGVMTYKDATLNAMENGVTDWAGETSKNILFLQNQEGKILVTPAVAAKYGLVGGEETRDLDTFVHDTTGKNKTARPIYRQEPVYRKEEIMQDVEVEDRDKIIDFTKVANVVNSTPTRTTSFAPVENSSALNIANDCNKFQNVVTPRNTSGLTEITSATTTLISIEIANKNEINNLLLSFITNSLSVKFYILKNTLKYFPFIMVRFKMKIALKFIVKVKIY